MLEGRTLRGHGAPGTVIQLRWLRAMCQQNAPDSDVACGNLLKSRIAEETGTAHASPFVLHRENRTAAGLFDQMLDRAGEIEVFLCKAAGVVGGKSEEHAVVADIDVGVVFGFFGEFADLIHEEHRGSEVFELKFSDELSGFNLPAGKACETGLGFFLSK
jgi:hypothetical protein